MDKFFPRPAWSAKTTTSTPCPGWKAQRKENCWGREPTLGPLSYTAHSYWITSPFPTLWNRQWCCCV